jgi:aryl-alcohol dehydrogenase-like predicted oxidoreductase
MGRLALSCVVVSVVVARGELQMRNLGASSLRVTEACLGTMTWGIQNTEADAHAQLDYAIKQRGINMIDTAEMYPVPSNVPEWRPGRTEEIVGSWIAANPEWRSKIVLATKVAGYWPESPVAAARTLPPTSPVPDCRLDKASVRAACEASLRRLQTDYIDLLQLHWPDRYVPLFGGTQYDLTMERESIDIEETAAALKELLDKGKIKAYGLSNETPYGVCEWMRVAAMLGMPPPATIQNTFNLLCRNFEDGGLAEACSPRHHNVGLLPWSVLAGGLLSGKYRAEHGTEAESRFETFADYMKRWHPKHAKQATLDATEAYCAIAERAGLSPSALAINYCRSRPSTAHGSVIIGATNLRQLEENIDAFLTPVESVIGPDIAAAINEVHTRCRDPSNNL